MPRGDSYQELFANRNFVFLWLGQALSHLGQSFTLVAVALHVYDVTGSPQQVSLATALQLVPWVVVGPLAGLLADRVQRKRVLVVGFLFQAGLVAMLPFSTELGQIYALLFVASLFVPITKLVWAASLPAVTGRAQLVRGYSLDIAALNVAHVAGPVLAGLLVGLAGARPTFVFVVICYAGSALLSQLAVVPGPEIGRDRVHRLGTFWYQLREGFRHLFKNPVLRYLVVLNCIASFGWSAPIAATVAYLTDTLGLGGEEYGLLSGTMSLSMALGAYLLGRYFRLFSRRRLIIGGVVVAGVGYTLLVLNPRLVPLLGLWFLIGLAWAAFWLANDTVFVWLTPDRMRGRVFSLADATIYSAETAWVLVGGWVASQWGPTAALFVIGLTIVGGSIVLSASSAGYRALSSPGEDVYAASRSTLT